MDDHVLLTGLRRSGTTMAYHIFQSSPSITAFDEPFRPGLRGQLAAFDGDLKDTSEITRPYARRRREIMDRWSWISPDNELIDAFTIHGRAYIGYLLEQDDHVFVDFTRANCRIMDLRQSFPDTTVAFQLRDPRAWVTSHARPCFPIGNGQFTRDDLRPQFFNGDWDFGYWRMDEIAQACGLGGPSIAQLLQVWNGMVWSALEQRPDRILQYEQVCNHPEAYLRDLLSDSTIDHELLDWSFVREPNPPAFAEDDRWDDLIETYIDPELRSFVHGFEREPATETP